MSATPIVVAWSGGKDSSLTIAALRADPAWRIVALLTTVTSDYDRISIHGVRRSILVAQAEALNLPLYEAPILAVSSNDAYEAAFAATLRRVRAEHPDARHIAFGDLFLEDVRAYREKLLPPLGWTGVYPLWGRDTTQLAREFITAGFRATLCCIDTTQLGAEFAGRSFDGQLLSEFPPGVDPCGERGEFHTCVHAGPIFSREIRVESGERVLRDNRFQYCDLSLSN